jgi:hypothetical protein
MLLPSEEERLDLDDETDPVDGCLDGKAVVCEPSFAIGLSNIPPLEIGELPGSAMAGLGGMSKLEPEEALEEALSRLPRSMLGVLLLNGQDAVLVYMHAIIVMQLDLDKETRSSLASFI